MNCTLEEFISKNKTWVAKIVSSLHSSYLDCDDVCELQYTGLWKVWKNFNPSRGTSLSTYLTSSIRNYALNLIRQKKKWKSREISLNEVGIEKEYYQTEDPSESFLPSEWSAIKQAYESKSSYEFRRIALAILNKRK